MSSSTALFAVPIQTSDLKHVRRFEAIAKMLARRSRVGKERDKAGKSRLEAREATVTRRLEA